MTDESPAPISQPVATAAVPFRTKWWTYQRERFPIVAHGTLIAAFSFCAVSLSAILREGPHVWPTWRSIVVAFVTCFGFFLQLRIADEFKDLEEDTKYRPYRPVPRGLVTLRELGWLFAAVAGVQLAAAVWLDGRLVVMLAITWAYLALMSYEFFVADWLRPRAVLYLLSHMLIMPLVDGYATSADWLPVGARPPGGLLVFLAASYCNGLVIEIGRKIRSPADEEAGVSTYSVLWGRPTAVAVWWAMMAASALLAMAVAWPLAGFASVAVVLSLTATGGGAVGLVFLGNAGPGAGKRIETYSGVWTIVLYLSLGLLPHWAGR